MKIKFLKNAMGIGLGYFKDDIADFNDKQAAEIIELDYAEIFKPVINNLDSDLPSDFPGRKKLIEAGVKTIDDVTAIADITEIRGIGNILAEEIKEYINGL